MWLNNFGVHSNTHLNTVKLTVLEVIIFNKNTELLPSGKYSDLSTDNNDTTEVITFIFVGITFRNQPVRVEVDKEDLTGFTKTSSIFLRIFGVLDNTKLFWA